MWLRLTTAAVPDCQKARYSAARCTHRLSVCAHESVSPSNAGRRSQQAAPLLAILLQRSLRGGEVEATNKEAPFFEVWPAATLLAA